MDNDMLVYIVAFDKSSYQILYLTVDVGMSFERVRY